MASYERIPRNRARAAEIERLGAPYPGPREHDPEYKPEYKRETSYREIHGLAATIVGSLTVGDSLVGRALDRIFRGWFFSRAVCARPRMCTGELYCFSVRAKMATSGECRRDMDNNLALFIHLRARAHVRLVNIFISIHVGQ